MILISTTRIGEDQWSYASVAQFVRYYLQEECTLTESSERRIRFMLTEQQEERPTLFIEADHDGGIYAISCMVDSLDKKELTDAMKRLIYQCFRKIGYSVLPWGILTGVRPGKIVRKLFREGHSYEEIQSILEQYYIVNSENAKELLVIHQTQNRMEAANPDAICSVYISIPFCPSRCNYCSFYSCDINKNHSLVAPYLNALAQELERFVPILLKYDKIESIYVGGGTPSSLSEKELESFMIQVGTHIPINDDIEFTFEAGRPDTINKQKLEILKRFGVNRISINPQTMNDESLRKANRKHSSQDIIESFYLARDVGFQNINMDVILGLDGEGETEVANTFDRLKELLPDSITVHSLTLKKSAPLNEVIHDRGAWLRNNVIFDSMKIAKQACSEMGMHPYYLYRQKNSASFLENIGFSLRGRESLYNIAMIEELHDVYGFGAHASSKLFCNGSFERFVNPKFPRDYLRNIKENSLKRVSYLME